MTPRKPFAFSLRTQSQQIIQNNGYKKRLKHYKTFEPVFLV
jgi:hypothetical protein